MRPGMDPAVGDELGDREAGDLAADRVEAREDDRLGGVVDDQVDAGRLLEGADVAALAADDPALHLVARQVDDRDRVLGGVVRGDALHRRDDDLAGLVVGLLAGPALDRPGELDGVVLGLLADRLEQDPLGVLGRQPGHALEGGDLLLVGPAELLALVLDLALAVDELAALLLEHVGALVELLVAGEQPALEVLELRALGAGLVLGLALQAQLLVLGLEDQVLLLGPGLGHDARGLVLGGLDATGSTACRGRRTPRRRRRRPRPGWPRWRRSAPSSVPPIRRDECAGRADEIRARATRHRHSLGLGNGAGLGRAPPAPHRCRGSPGARPTVRVRLTA